MRHLFRKIFKGAANLKTFHICLALNSEGPRKLFYRVKDNKFEKTSFYHGFNVEASKCIKNYFFFRLEEFNEKKGKKNDNKLHEITIHLHILSCV